MEFRSSMISTSFLLLLLTVHCLADGGDYSPTPYNSEDKKPEPEYDGLLSNKIAIQGMVFCKSGPNYKIVPLEGAVVRFTCVGENEYGEVRPPFSFLSGATDEKGYFFATLCPSEVPANKKIVRQCTAFLELSPDEDCSVPTNINNGITGATLSSAQDYKDKNLKLYTVGPFFYTSGPKPASNNNYGY